MFAKVLIVCTMAVAAFAAVLPAGIHPALCPNYPLCDKEVLARHTPEGIPIPDWELPYARMVSAAVPYVAKTFDYPAVIPYVAKPGRFFEYPFARMVSPLKTVPVVAEEKAVEYPADVDPASCPNYPYCA